jgi:hypothetical protein
MMNQRTLFKFLLGFLLAGRTVVADDDNNLAISNQTTAEARRVSPVPLHASATDAVSATTSNLRTTSIGTTTSALPPLPPGVTELKFGEFFRQPVGPRGLELTETLRALDDRRVRLVGFMVREHEPSRTGSFLLAPFPVTLDEEEFGLCDDLPANATLVQVPKRATEIIPHQPGRVIVIATLHLGVREETNGRVFLVRLTLDEPYAAN